MITYAGALISAFAFWRRRGLIRAPAAEGILLTACRRRLCLRFPIFSRLILIIIVEARISAFIYEFSRNVAQI